MIDIQNLTRIYDGRAAVDDVSLTVEPGQIAALVAAPLPAAREQLAPPIALALSLVALVATVPSLLDGRLRFPVAGVGSLCLGLLAAGVSGNLMDRIFRTPGFLRGHVVDFFQLPRFAIINVADVCINIAAGLIILQTFRGVALDGSRDADHRPGPDSPSTTQA